MIDQIVESLCSETDSARSIAGSGSGIAGSVIDLKQCDWFIAAFSGVFVFSVARLLSARIYERIHRAEKHRTEREETNERSNLMSLRRLYCKPLSRQAGRCLRGYMSML